MHLPSTSRLQEWGFFVIVIFGSSKTVNNIYMACAILNNAHTLGATLPNLIWSTVCALQTCFTSEMSQYSFGIGCEGDSHQMAVHNFELFIMKFWVAVILRCTCCICYNMNRSLEAHSSSNWDITNLNKEQLNAQRYCSYCEGFTY